MLRYKAEEAGIIFTVTEEAYTSKASFLDGDSLFKYGDKPVNYTFSGKRIHRGMYRASNGTLINADVNGAYNILRKVASNTSIVEGVEGVRLHPSQKYSF
jgi:transposase